MLSNQSRVKDFPSMFMLIFYPLLFVSSMREMMRTTDRSMANIESHPEGFNALRSMYENIQEPLMDAVSGANRTESQGANAQASTPVPQGGPPNSAPLPNPWGAPAPQAQQPAAATYVMKAVGNQMLFLLFVIDLLT